MASDFIRIQTQDGRTIELNQKALKGPFQKGQKLGASANSVFAQFEKLNGTAEKSDGFFDGGEFGTAYNELSKFADEKGVVSSEKFQSFMRDKLPEFTKKDERAAVQNAQDFLTAYSEKQKAETGKTQPKSTPQTTPKTTPQTTPITSNINQNTGEIIQAALKDAEAQVKRDSAQTEKPATFPEATVNKGETEPEAKANRPAPETKTNTEALALMPSHSPTNKAARTEKPATFPEATVNKGETEPGAKANRPVLEPMPSHTPTQIAPKPTAEEKKTQPELVGPPKPTTSDNTSIEPKNKELTVAKWGSKPQKGDKSSNDCLERIIRNNYPEVKPYSKEYNTLMNEIATKNPNAFGKTKDGKPNYDIMKPGEKVELPTIDKATGKTAEVKEAKTEEAKTEEQKADATKTERESALQDLGTQTKDLPTYQKTAIEEMKPYITKEKAEDLSKYLQDNKKPSINDIEQHLLESRQLKEQVRKDLGFWTNSDWTKTEAEKTAREALRMALVEEGLKPDSKEYQERVASAKESIKQEEITRAHNFAAGSGFAH